MGVPAVGDASEDAGFGGEFFGGLVGLGALEGTGGVFVDVGEDFLDFLGGDEGGVRGGWSFKDGGVCEVGSPDFGCVAAGFVCLGLVVADFVFQGFVAVAVESVVGAHGGDVLASCCHVVAFGPDFFLVSVFEVADLDFLLVGLCWRYLFAKCADAWFRYDWPDDSCEYNRWSLIHVERAGSC